MTKPIYSCSFVRWQDSVILVRKNHSDWQSGRLNGIGGLAKSNESPLQCAVREWHEEVRLIAGPGDHPVPAEPHLEEFLVYEDDHAIVHMFRGHIDRDVDCVTQLPQHNDAGETVQLSPLNAAFCEWQHPESAIDNLCWLIPMAFHDPYHRSGTAQGYMRVRTAPGQPWAPSR